MIWWSPSPSWLLYVVAEVKVGHLHIPAMQFHQHYPVSAATRPCAQGSSPPAASFVSCSQGLQPQGAILISTSQSSSKCAQITFIKKKWRFHIYVEITGLIWGFPPPASRQMPRFLGVERPQSGWFLHRRPSSCSGQTTEFQSVGIHLNRKSPLEALSSHIGFNWFWFTSTLKAVPTSTTLEQCGVTLSLVSSTKRLTEGSLSR